MVGKEYRQLKPGFYKLHWKSGGTSLAAIGVTADGHRWIAPINWVSISAENSVKHWRLIEKVEELVFDV